MKSHHSIPVAWRSIEIELVFLFANYPSAGDIPTIGILHGTLTSRGIPRLPADPRKNRLHTPGNASLARHGEPHIGSRLYMRLGEPQNSEEQNGYSSHFAP